MTLGIKLNGALYTNFISARVAKSIDALTTAFSFTSTVNTENLFPIRNGDIVEILADDIKLMTGNVEGLLVSYDARSHTIEISGRGILADLIDSSVKITKEFTGGVFLTDVARTVLDNLGLDEVNIINNAGNIDIFQEAEIISADVGQGAFDFLEKYARRRQVLLNEDEDGNLIFSRATAIKTSQTLHNIVGRTDNNVLAGKLNLDYTNRYNQYVVRSQLNPVFQELGVTPELISDQNGKSTDSAIRLTRFLELNSEESSDSKDAKNRAIWENNIRRSRAFTYTATVQGHSFNGVLLQPNTLIQVQDDFCDIDSILLIRGVEYTYDLASGSQLVLTCAPKDSYKLEAEKNQRDANTTVEGNGFL